MIYTNDNTGLALKVFSVVHRCKEYVEIKGLIYIKRNGWVVESGTIKITGHLKDRI